MFLLAGLAYLLALSCCSCAKLLAPSRPLLLVKGLELPPGATVKSRMLTMRYLYGARSADSSESLQLEFQPSTGWDELFNFLDVRFQQLGFSKDQDKPEITESEYGTRKKIGFSRPIDQAHLDLMFIETKPFDSSMLSFPRDQTYALLVKRPLKAPATKRLCLGLKLPRGARLASRLQFYTFDPSHPAASRGKLESISYGFDYEGDWNSLSTHIERSLTRKGYISWAAPAGSSGATANRDEDGEELEPLGQRWEREDPTAGSEAEESWRSLYLSSKDKKTDVILIYMKNWAEFPAEAGLLTPYTLSVHFR